MWCEKRDGELSSAAPKIGARKVNLTQTWAQINNHNEWATRRLPENRTLGARQVPVSESGLLPGQRCYCLAAVS